MVVGEWVSEIRQSKRQHKHNLTRKQEGRDCPHLFVVDFEHCHPNRVSHPTRLAPLVANVKQLLNKINMAKIEM